MMISKRVAGFLGSLPSSLLQQTHSLYSPLRQVVTACADALGVLRCVLLNLWHVSSARDRCLSYGNLGSCLHYRGDLELGVGLGLRLGLVLALTLGKTDNAACDALAHAFSHAEVFLGSCGMLNLVVVIFALVENHGATEHRVGAAEHDKKITLLVLRLSAPADRHLLKVTDAAIHNVEVSVALFGTEWVINTAGGFASVLKIAILMNLHSMHAWLDAPEASENSSEITGLLFKLNAAARIRVAEEIELARGLDSFGRLLHSSVIAIKRSSLEGLDVARTDGRALGVGVALSGGLTIGTVAAITAEATAVREDLATAQTAVKTLPVLLGHVLLTWGGLVSLTLLLLLLLGVSSRHDDCQGTQELHFQAFRISYLWLSNKVLNKLHSTEIR